MLCFANFINPRRACFANYIVLRSVGRALCLGYRVSWVRVPPEAAHFFLGKVTALGVLCCFALFVCLTLLASFFLPSHLLFKNIYMHLARGMMRMRIPSIYVQFLRPLYIHSRGLIDPCMPLHIRTWYTRTMATRTTPVRECSELQPFVLLNVRLTGTRIGAGAYGSVDEAQIPGTLCAVKKIHDIFQDRSEIAAADIQRATTQFVEECKMMSTLRHPHIVQFLGVCFFTGSRLPALVMERLVISLHDLLVPENDEPPSKFLSLGLKCSILRDVARGLVYLHDRSSPIIHRDLSARNVLLNSAMVAQISDLGVARILPRMRAAATMTKAPGASIYMPPEVCAATASDEEQSKYDASIDVFHLVSWPFSH